MATNFPTSLDSLSNPIGTDKVANADPLLKHATQHSNANDAIEALEAKVGANGSAVTTSHDYKLGEVTGSDKAVSKTATQTLTNKTLTSPTITNKTSTGTDNGTETLVNKTLTSPTLTTPTIASFVNAQHDHLDADDGGQLTEGALNLADVTTNDVSITKHGFVPKAPNNTSTYLRGDATWASIGGTGKFGGTGADGALTQSVGAFNIDLGGAQVFVKNYTSISITGTGYITFTNKHVNGTQVIFKSQGNVTITSSATRAIDLIGLGGNGGADKTGGGAPFPINSVGGSGASVANDGAGGGSSTVIYGLPNPGQNTYGILGLIEGGKNSGTDYTNAKGKGILSGFNCIVSKALPLQCGAGGSSAYAAASLQGRAGGAGGGALYIECNGAYSVSGTLDASGVAGTNATGGDRSGHGGGGGTIIALYTTLTSDTGTYNVAGGAGGTGGAASGSAGGNGYQYRGLNTEFQ